MINRRYSYNNYYDTYFLEPHPLAVNLNEMEHSSGHLLIQYHQFAVDATYYMHKFTT